MVADERPKEWRIGIHDLWPNAAPLVHLVDRVGKEKASDVEFFWWERSYPERVLTIAAGTVPGASAAGTTEACTVTAGDAYNVVKGMVLVNGRTMERVWVTTDPTTNASITIYRGVGSTGTQTAMQAGDSLIVIGTANPEGGSVPTAISYDPVKKTNYIQTFRRATDNTRIALRTKLRTGDLRRRAQEEALKLWTTEKERAYLLGVPSELTVNGEIIRTTGGLSNYVTTHVWDASTGITLEGLRSFLYDLAADSPSEEVLLLATSDLYRALEACFEYNSIRTRDVPTDDAFGMRLRSFEMGGLTVMMHHHRDLSRLTSFSGWGFIVDPEALVQRFIDDVKWVANRQNPGDDKNIGEYIGDFGLEVHNEEQFGIIEAGTTFLP